jgi:hypothetical protein
VTSPGRSRSSSFNPAMRASRSGRSRKSRRSRGTGYVGQPPPPLPAPYATAGQPQPSYHVQPRSAALAVIASLFIPGLGSMINGKVGKGIAILISSIVAGILCLVIIGFILADRLDLRHGHSEQ